VQQGAQHVLQSHVQPLQRQPFVLWRQGLIRR
jgi:hypothetical protein